MCIPEPYLLERKTLAGRLVHCGSEIEICELLCAEQSMILENLKEFPSEICQFIFVSIYKQLKCRWLMNYLFNHTFKSIIQIIFKEKCN